MRHLVFFVKLDLRCYIVKLCIQDCTHGCRTTKQFLRGAQRPPILQIDHKASHIKGLCVPKSNM